MIAQGFVERGVDTIIVGWNVARLVEASKRASGFVNGAVIPLDGGMIV